VYKQFKLKSYFATLDTFVDMMLSVKDREGLVVDMRRQCNEYDASVVSNVASPSLQTNLTATLFNGSKVYWTSDITRSAATGGVKAI